MAKTIAVRGAIEGKPYRKVGKHSYHYLRVGPIPDDIDRVDMIKWVERDGEWYVILMARRPEGYSAKEADKETAEYDKNNGK